MSGEFLVRLHLIQHYIPNNEVYLIRPITHIQYGFSSLDNLGLKNLYANKVQITKLNIMGELWRYYQIGNTEALLVTAEKFAKKFPFILNAVGAHIERLPTEFTPGRPIKSLIEIMKEFNTVDFPTVFREFNKREAIYGYGDLQVKKMFDGIVDHKRATN